MKKVVASLSFLLGVTVLALSDAWGQVTPDGATPAAAGAPSPWASMLPMVLVFVVFYFLLIRPQQKRHKEQQSMLTALKQGDEVLTSGGILGKITHITDKVVTVEIAEAVRVKMLKSQIAQVVKGPIQDLVSN